MEFDKRYKLMLRLLSENSRATVTELAKNIGTSRVTVVKLLKKLSEDYGLHYTIEVDDDKLGFTQRHLVMLKFDRKPTPDELKKAFEKDRFVSNAYLCNGDFDVIVHTRASNAMDYIMWESQLPSKFENSNITIRPSAIMVPNYGYFPIGAEELKSVATEIDTNERAMLKTLSSNSRARLIELARDTKARESTVNYRLSTLKKSGVVKRFTISASKPPYAYILAFLVNYHFNSTTYVRSVEMMNYYKNYDQDMSLFSTFQLLVPMSGSFRFFGMGLFKNESDAMENAINAHKNIFNQEKPEIAHAQVTGLIKGRYPFRNLDIKTNYTRFKWSMLDMNSNSDN
ncbi:MAG: winged helix-turn-helix transcriptional regulator [Candidatus Micrarchaeia archaeon]